MQNSKPRKDLEAQWLVLRCQAGDERAFALLVTRWQKRLWSFARRMVGDRDVAFDIVQDTWVSVIGSLPKLDTPDRFQSWIFQIVANRCADWHRARGRIASLAERQRAEAPKPSGLPAWQTRDLRRAIETLSPAQKGLIHLKIYEGFKIREIADILKLPVGTVKSRLHTIYRHLESRLKGEAP